MNQQEVVKELRAAGRRSSRNLTRRKKPIGEFTHLHEWIMVDEARALFNLQKKLPPHPLEIPEMLFDRLFLHISHNYRVTRKLALDLGAKFRPEMASKSRALIHFDPSGNIIPYAPINSEFDWLTRQPKSPFILEKIISARHFACTIYHETTHFIFYTLLRTTTTLRTETQFRLYFSLIESLVVTRDIELSEELGGVAVPLSWAGALYRSRPQAYDFEPRMAPLSFEEFSGVHSYAFFENMGVPRKRISVLHRKLGIPETKHPLRFTDQTFVRTTAEDWFQFFMNQRKNRKKLPVLSKKAKRLQYKVPLVAPEKWLARQDEQRDLYDWLRKVFAEKK